MDGQNDRKVWSSTGAEKLFCPIFLRSAIFVLDFLKADDLLLVNFYFGD